MNLPPSLASQQEIVDEFLKSYTLALQENGHSAAVANESLQQLISLAAREFKEPTHFGVYHKMTTTPFDYHAFSMEFVERLIQWKHSKLQGLDALKTIEALVKKGENVVLFANHQIEPDPQVLLLVLERNAPALVDKMIIVAGHRVTTDPLSIPFSKGCNLLCIYSKNYIDHPPEKKEEKVRHNGRAMRMLGELLQEGGKCIYVAPSGGRDRRDEQGNLYPRLFDPQSIEMFHFIAEKHPEKKTHFFPLALCTHTLLPPPPSIHKELGERRLAFASPVALSFGEELDLEQFKNVHDRKERRGVKRDYVFDRVLNLYERIWL